VTATAQSQMSFRPTDGVQVRQESFGLLFYNYRGPRLFFVPTKDLIDADFFTGRQTVSDLIKSICRRKGLAQAKVGTTIAGILAKLEEKGLINGQPIR
jgi:putative mycofactocin binding protein MftB